MPSYCIAFAIFISSSLYAAIDNQKVIQFVQKNNLAQNLSSSEYTNFISAGSKTLKSILSGSKSALFNRQRVIQNIVNILWYLYAVAVSKNQGFNSGTIVIEDPGMKLYNFLFEYVKKVNPDGLKKAVIVSTNPYAYARKSTHFNDEQKNYIQYGIDVRLEDGEKAKAILPNNSTHLLFGRIGDNLMFVKMEGHGLYIKDGVIGHTGGLFKSIGKKIKAKITGGKSEDSLARKEHMPQALKKEYEKICKDNKLTCKAKTIKDMVVQSSRDGALVALVSKMAGKYDYMTLRHGNEVILMQSDLW